MSVHDKKLLLINLFVVLKSDIFLVLKKKKL